MDESAKNYLTNSLGIELPETRPKTAKNSQYSTKKGGLMSRTVFYFFLLYRLKLDLQLNNYQELDSKELLMIKFMVQRDLNFISEIQH